jgi:N-carbamoyl-L-amino-acid hydrolase
MDDSPDRDPDHGDDAAPDDHAGDAVAPIGRSVARAVDGDRLRRDLEANAAFGAIDHDDPDARGRTVLAGTDASRRARERLVDRLRAAGLDVRVDAVGTIVGRWTPAGARPDAAPVAAGSHLDSVPEGGIFDGPLGVYAALEAVRAIDEAGAGDRLDRPVEVVSFTEEEGARFSAGLTGSAVAAGVRSVEETLALTDDDGVTLGDAMERIGFAGEGRVDVGDWDAWLELHVEQDSRLAAAGVPVGVVTTITGIARREATIRGEADHAGTTGMDDRSDALAAAAEVVLDVESAAREVVAAADGARTAVGTVGSCTVSPNAANVVPGRVDLGVDVRDVRRSSMDRLLDATDESLSRVATERDVAVDATTTLDLDPAPMADRVRRAVHRAGDAAGVATTDLHSGAAHDTMHVARETDAGLLFAPSRDGRSHSPYEWTDWDDCAAATRVLATALATLAGAGGGG